MSGKYHTGLSIRYVTSTETSFTLKYLCSCASQTSTSTRTYINLNCKYNTGNLIQIRAHLIKMVFQRHNLITLFYLHSSLNSMIPFLVTFDDPGPRIRCSTVSYLNIDLHLTNSSFNFHLNFARFPLGAPNSVSC